MRERRFPKFAIPDGKSELEYNKTYIEELRSQVNMLMANLESVPVSRSTAGQNYSRVIQKMQANPLALLDHKAEDEGPGFTDIDCNVWHTLLHSLFCVYSITQC